MPENVLLITGGLITSQERSILHAGRKWLAQMIGAKAAWLDCKVKLAIAEPMIASRVERARFRMRSPPWRPIVDELFADRGRYDAPSLTEVVLSTLLERAGIAHECTTFDELFGAPRRMSRLLEGTGCVFLSTTYLHDLSELEPLVRRVKRPHNRVVVGGALMGAIAHAWEGMDGVDLVAVGYGELMMDAIAGWIRGGYGNPPPPPQGRVEHKRHSMFLYSGVPASTCLDTLPPPDWALAQRRHRRRFPMIYYESVRGCPYRCAFCNYPFLFDDTQFRHKSAERMAHDWGGYVQELGVETITCLDSLFTVPRQRLRRFCRLLVDRGIKVKWVCYARADDLADEETVLMMRQAGAHQVQIGIESGDSRQLANMNKACSVESNRRALANCRRHGLTTIVSLIVGYPGETDASIDRTYRFLDTARPDFYFLATFSTRVAGVPLLSPASRRRFGLRVMDNLYSMAPYWEHDTMSCRDVVNHVQRLDRRIMTNRVSLNATLFYERMLDYRPRQREALLDFQHDAVSGHPVVAAAFDVINRIVDRRLRDDVLRHLRLVSPEPGVERAL